MTQKRTLCSLSLSAPQVRGLGPSLRNITAVREESGKLAGPFCVPNPILVPLQTLPGRVSTLRIWKLWEEGP